MHSMFKFILVDERDSRIILSGNNKEELVNKASDFTLNGSGASYNIYEHTVKVSHVRKPVISLLGE